MENGELMKPGYVTQTFSKVLDSNNLRHIRLHDLRHSCASLLLARGIPLKEIQAWLGHSNFNTTANIYAHLDTNVLSNILNGQKNVPTYAKVDNL